MLIDMEQSPEKLKWLDGCQHHFESPSLTTDFFFFSTEKEKKLIQWSRGTALIKAFLYLLCIFQTSRKSLSGKSETFAKYISYNVEKSLQFHSKAGSDNLVLNMI